MKNDPQPLQQLLTAAGELGELVEKAQRELDPDQYRVIERNAERAVATLQRAAQQFMFIEDMFLRFKGRPLRRRPQHAILYDFKPTKKRPPRGPGKKG